MSGTQSVKSTQISIDRRRNDRRVTSVNYGASATLITQVIVEHQRTINTPRIIRQPRNNAIDAYRAGGMVTVKRAPAGLTHRQII